MLGVTSSEAFQGPARRAAARLGPAGTKLLSSSALRMCLLSLLQSVLSARTTVAVHRTCFNSSGTSRNGPRG